jgi:hypothetical protein
MSLKQKQLVEWPKFVSRSPASRCYRTRWDAFSQIRLATNESRLDT